MPANFDYIAPFYRWLEYLTLGLALERCREHFLPLVSRCGQVLVLGDGDGRFLARLVAANPSLNVTAVDTSAAMLALLRGRCEKVVPGARLTVYHGDALDHEPAVDTDLIVAHFFLDCLLQHELDSLIARFSTRIRADALWLISDFRIPTGPMRAPAKLFVRTLYLAFRLLTGLRPTRLPNHQRPLRTAGLIRVAQQVSMAGLLTTELWRRPVGAPL